MEIRGHVQIKDKNIGSIIVDKDNLILNGGRELLATLFYNNISGIELPTTNLKVKYGITTSIPSSDDGINSINGTAVADLTDKVLEGTDIKFITTISGTGEFNSLGLFYGDDGFETLITRIIFERFPLGSASYELTYTMHF